MSDDLRPVGGLGGIDPARDRREGDRRQRQRREASRDLVPVEPEVETPDIVPARAAVHPAPEAGSTAFFAQQLGQTGQRRGLKGGPPVLDAARAAYMGTEYSGPAERRPPVGKATDTDI